MDDIEVVPEELGMPSFVKAGLAGGAARVKDIEDDWDDLHDRACARGDKFYTDPSTGYLVMTKVNHLARGRCCGSGCRHCPYSHANVRDKASRIQMPAMMHTPASGLAPEVTVLMWSGGKDSFLALRAMLRPGGRLHAVGPSGVVLLTTFDASTRMVAHQDVSARDIVRQAKHLDVALVGAPLHRNAGSGYVARLRGALEVVRKAGCEVTALACGDLHLEHIRSWREEAVGRGLGVNVCYPVWSDVAGANYPALSADLRDSGVPCTITAVTEERCERAGAIVGAAYGPELAEAVTAAGADAFGENGEFHTLAAVWETSRERALGLAS
jgi:diphthamide synthase (EF-2-diphthine--ammonia ligase)